MLDRCSMGVLLLACACSTGYASSTLEDVLLTDEALHQAERLRRQEQQRQLESQAPDVHTPNPVFRARGWVQGERPCSPVHHIELIGPSASEFAWLRSDFPPFLGHCLGVQSIEALAANLNDRLAQAGYITSRVSIPPQQLDGSPLVLRVHAGRIGQLRMDAEVGQASQVPWPLTLRSGLALRPGALLNIRDLDQGAENIQRLGHDLKLFIVPKVSSAPSDSQESDSEADIVAQWLQPTRPWQLILGLDNSSSPVMGRTRLSAQMAWDNPLGLADQFYATLGSNVEAPGPSRRSLSSSATYTLPWGRHRWTFTRSVGRSGQQIRGTLVNFMSTRYDSEQQASWKVVVYRDGQYKLAFDTSYGVRVGNSHIEDVELMVQRRDATVRSLGGSLSWLGQNASAQVNLSLTRVVPKAPKEDFYGLNTDRTLNRRLAVDFARELAIDGKPWRYTMRADVLSTQNPTHLSDVITLGGRYTVRGFSGDRAVSATDGMVVRQELLAPSSGKLIPGALLQPYMAWDQGWVWGPTAPTSGRYASGLVLGLRGTSRAWSLDVAVSTPGAGRAIQRGDRWVPYISIHYSI